MACDLSTISANPADGEQGRLHVTQIYNAVFHDLPMLNMTGRFADIKHNLKTRPGLHKPMEITRRPGDAMFSIYAGGFCRLAILKELWLETADDVFAWVPVIFRSTKRTS